MTKAWFRMKWFGDCNSFQFSIETMNSESKFMISRRQAEGIIKALQQEQEELIFEV